MDFHEALKFIPKGYSIMRFHWDEIKILNYNEVTNIADTEIGTIELKSEDLKASDWIVRWE